MIILFTKFFIEPWVENKIRAVLKDKISKYMVDIEKIHVSIFTLGLELKNISVNTNQEHRSDADLNASIESISIKGIDPWKIIFKNDITINKITISNINGVIPVSDDSIQPVISTLNIRIDEIFFEKINLKIKNKKSTQSYTINEGALYVYDWQVLKKESLSSKNIKQIGFKSKEFHIVTADSMYLFSANDLIYSSTTNNLTINNILIHPNYKGYDFTSRHKYQTDCIEAEFKNIYINEFPAIKYLQSGSLICSYVEIGDLEVNVFRDNRKDFLHKNKTQFQDLIYNYPGSVNIDSIGVINGNVTYTEHDEKANHPGRISFNKINAKIYTLTNDTIFKTDKAYLEFKSNSLLMGKSRLSIQLKSQLYDSQNTFSLNGTLSGMEAKDLNPMLERNAFLYASSGIIDEMNFSFTANNKKATGKMTMLYHGLDIAVKNEYTDDTTAIKEKITSFFANIKILDSNPLSGKMPRVGIINFERNPETFLFSYCFKSILSGCKSSIAKSSSGKKN